MRWFDHIGERPDVLGGKPVIKGTRISVELVLEWFSNGETEAGLLTSYPTLKSDDVRAALKYAAVAVGLHADAVFEAAGFEYGLYAGRPLVPAAEAAPSLE